MSADVIALRGRHGVMVVDCVPESTAYGSAGLAAAQALIAGNMRRESDRAEANMRECRKLLGYAREVFPVNVELADAFGARAANKLALALGARP